MKRTFWRNHLIYVEEKLPYINHSSLTKIKERKKEFFFVKKNYFNLMENFPKRDRVNQKGGNKKFK